MLGDTELNHGTAYMVDISTTHQSEEILFEDVTSWNPAASTLVFLVSSAHQIRVAENIPFCIQARLSMVPAITLVSDLPVPRTDDNTPQVTTEIRVRLAGGGVLRRGQIRPRDEDTTQQNDKRRRIDEEGDEVIIDTIRDNNDDEIDDDPDVYREREDITFF
ncbi:hypothetical protein BDC45DRAFT_520003 [Circinella umbellata]|nr:hypothetical protein BDC45DRAFT_520003 [Circinella umbellata]